MSNMRKTTLVHVEILSKVSGDTIERYKKRTTKNCVRSVASQVPFMSIVLLVT